MQNRIYKFRAWNKGRKEMAYPKGTVWLAVFWQIIETDPYNFEVMQYTGLRDKNGKEIYEFDQLKGDWDVVNDICLGTVEFYGGAFRIKETGLPLAWADKDKDCEVVGNKFEGLQNPSKGDIM